MSREIYADTEYYKDTYQGNEIPDGDIAKCLKLASRHIDSLTYNRIVGKGIAGLTPFQQETIQEVACAQAEFEYLNKEIFEMILKGYAINNVKMEFGESWNVTIQKGIPMRRDVHEQLSRTGLTCRLAV